nr:hypothetical protein [Tanacetum cinerariifolium]
MCEWCGNDLLDGFCSLCNSRNSCFPAIHQPPQEMSIQEIENMKQHYLDETKRLINLEYRDEIKIDELKGSFNSVEVVGLGEGYYPLDFEGFAEENEGKKWLCSMSIEINEKEKLLQLKQLANLSTYPLKRFNSFYYDDDDDDEDYTIAVTPSLSTEEPDNSLSMGTSILTLFRQRNRTNS